MRNNILLLSPEIDQEKYLKEAIKRIKARQAEFEKKSRAMKPDAEWYNKIYG